MLATQMAGISKIGVKKRLQILYILKIFLKNGTNKGIINKKLDDYKQPSFIKIDIEGHEYECILGSLKTIKNVTLFLWLNMIKLFIVRYYYLKIIIIRDLCTISIVKNEKFNDQKILIFFS